MLKGLGDIGQMMKLQKEFKSTQKNIMKTKMEGQSRNGEVKATVNGEYKVVDLKIDDAILQGDSGKVEKIVMEALNDAIEKVKDFSASEMSKLTGGLDIPGLSNFMK